MKGLVQGDSEIIDFVVACFIAGALSQEELRSWAKTLVESCNEYPLYLIDFMEFEGARLGVYQLMDFYPGGMGPSTPEAGTTINQIAYDRHEIANDDVGSADLKANGYACSETVKLFNDVFHFLPDIPLALSR